MLSAAPSDDGLLLPEHIETNDLAAFFFLGRFVLFVVGGFGVVWARFFLVLFGAGLELQREIDRRIGKSADRGGVVWANSLANIIAGCLAAILAWRHIRTLLRPAVIAA